MRSCCKQVRDFLDFGKHLHAALKQLYEELNEHTELERIKLLLDYLSRHEAHLEEALARFEKGSRSGILNAWLEYVPDLDVDAVMGKYRVEAVRSSDELIGMAMEFDTVLIELYREVSAKINDPKVKEVFLNLLALEEHEKIQVMRAALSFQDM
jgi:rubrerythrin